MKKFCAALCIAFFTLACGGGGGSDSDEGYKLEPGSLSKYSEVGAFSVNYSGAQTGSYAIIYKGTVGGKSYVGISIDNPSTPFNMKLYFLSDSLPSGDKTLTDGDDEFTIKINGGAGVIGLDDNITLNFQSLQSDNSITVTGVGGNNTIDVDTETLTINSIKAYYISGN